MSNIRVVDTGPGKAVHNMAVDWSLLQLRGEGAIPDTLRFYTWKEKTVTLGYSQDISRELDLDLCRKHNVETVFRPTGGALVLHQSDLTYSIVTEMPVMSPSMWTVFSRKVGCALCRGIKGLGVESTCAGGSEVRRRRNRGACFSSLATNEITVHGRKVVGNARRWKNGALLQHGSISIRREELSVVDFMAGLSFEERERKKRELKEQSTTIECETGRKTDYKELMHVVLNGFREEYGDIFIGGEIRKFEDSRVDECVDRVLQGPGYMRTSRKKGGGRRRRSVRKVEA